MAEVVHAKVFRYNPEVDKAPHYQTYEVPYVRGMVVRDVLHYIYGKV